MRWQAKATKSRAEIGLTIDQVLALTPGSAGHRSLLPTISTAPALVSSLKARPDSRVLRIILIVPGGSADRAHALNLGADDAVSLPLDGTEFAARIRAQFRERQSAARNADDAQVRDSAGEYRRPRRRVAQRRAR